MNFKKKKQKYYYNKSNGYTKKIDENVSYLFTCFNHIPGILDDRSIVSQYSRSNFLLCIRAVMRKIFIQIYYARNA